MGEDFPRKVILEMASENLRMSSLSGGQRDPVGRVFDRVEGSPREGERIYNRGGSVAGTGEKTQLCMYVLSIRCYRRAWAENKRQDR